MNNFKRAVDGTGTTKVEGKVTYICTLLSGEELQEFGEIASQNAGTNNAHLKFIQKGLIRYFLINTLSKQKRAMRCVILKTQDINFKRFAARLTKLNN